MKCSLVDHLSVKKRAAATTHKIFIAPLKFSPSFSPEVTALIRDLLKWDPRESLGSKDEVEEVKRHKVSGNQLV